MIFSNKIKLNQLVCCGLAGGGRDGSGGQANDGGAGTGGMNDAGGYGGDPGFDYDLDNELNDDTLANSTNYASDFSGRPLDFIDRALAYAGYNFDSFLDSFNSSSTLGKVGKVFSALKNPTLAVGIVLGTVVGKTAIDLAKEAGLSSVEAKAAEQAVAEFDKLSDEDKSQVKADVSKSVDTSISENSKNQGRGFSSDNLTGGGSNPNPVMSGDPNNPNWNASFDRNVRLGGWGMGPADIRKALKNPTDRYNLRNIVDLTQFGYSADGSELINPTQAQEYESLFQPYTAEMLSALESEGDGDTQMTTQNGGQYDDIINKHFNDLRGYDAKPEGIEYYTKQLNDPNSGVTLDNLKETILRGSYEGTINKHFNELFGRDANPEGIEYYTKRLNDPNSGVTLDNLKETILDGADGGSPDLTAYNDRRASFDQFVTDWFNTNGDKEKSGEELLNDSADHAANAANEYETNILDALSNQTNTFDEASGLLNDSRLEQDNYIDQYANTLEAGANKQGGLLDSLISDIQNGRDMYAPTEFLMGGQKQSFLNRGARNTANLIAQLGQQGYDNTRNYVSDASSLTGQKFDNTKDYTNTLINNANTSYNNKSSALSSILGNYKMTDPSAGALASLQANLALALEQEKIRQARIKEELEQTRLDNNLTLGQESNANTAAQIDQNEPGVLDYITGLGTLGESASGLEKLWNSIKPW